MEVQPKSQGGQRGVSRMDPDTVPPRFGGVLVLPRRAGFRICILQKPEERVKVKNV